MGLLMCNQPNKQSIHLPLHLSFVQRHTECNSEMPTMRHTCLLDIPRTHGKAMTTCNQVRNQSILLRLHPILCRQCRMCMTGQARFRTYFQMQANTTLQDNLSIALDVCK
jgi:hypothetical protein